MDPELTAPEDEEVGSPLPASSVMEQLREQYKELARQKTTQLAVPGYNGKLVAEYRLIDVTNELKKITARIRGQYKSFEEQALYSTMDIMALACEGMFYNNGDGLVPLSRSISEMEPPIKYDERLAEFLGFESHSAREAILGTFAYNEVGIMAHGQRLQQWMATMGEAVGAEFFGGEQ